MQRAHVLYVNSRQNEKDVRKASSEVARIEADMALLNRKILDQLKPPLSKKQLEDIRR